MHESRPTAADHRDAVIRRWGLRSWFLVGIVVLTTVAYAGLAAVSGLVVPLVVATVLGMLFAPLTDVVGRLLPRPLAAGLVLLALVSVSVAAVVVAVDGVVGQAPEIGRRLADGFAQVAGWLADLGLATGDANALVNDLGEVWSTAVPGLATYLSTVFSSGAAFLAGSFVAVFFLYFMLADWRELSGWVARHLGVPRRLGAEIVDDATWAIREYFIALTVSSVVVAVSVGAAIVVLGLPLAFTIAVVTFATSFVPYLGAIFSGAFAVLIALGSGGLTDAAIVLTVVLVAQNVVQPIVQTKLTEGRLSLHPVVIFGSTILGGAVAGLLGAALSTPLVAMAVRISGRLRDHATTTTS